MPPDSTDPPEPHDAIADREARLVNLSAPGLVIQPSDSVRFKSRVVELAPGDSVGLHVTHRREEIVVILAGKGELRLPEAKAAGTEAKADGGGSGEGNGAVGASDAGAGNGQAGNGQAGGGGRIFALEAGRAAYVPPETPHDIHNTGDAPLRYIYIVTLLE